ncbi:MULTISPECIES: ROK family protein [unclassified Knoellia]|uniref:ROK family protein n=1 Tax=Knoellia altitudinis TaxID=3404795 RepID=UPI003609F843
MSPALPARRAVDPGPAAAAVDGLRAANLARVVSAVLAAEAPPTRADVATAISVTRATASRLVDELLRGRVLAEQEIGSHAPSSRGTARRGRPGTPLVPRAGHLAALGLQVNVGHLAALVVDLSGAVLVERIELGDFTNSVPGEVLSRLSLLADEALRAAPPDLRLVGTGLAVPGIVAADGVLLRAPNLGWSDVAISELLDTESLGAGGLTIGNEAELAAAVVRLDRPGRSSGLTDFIHLSGEIGIGGAIVIDGRALPGRHGWAGEIGHVSVDPHGPACACGSTGCLELYAGKRAMLAAAGLPSETTAAELGERARGGDASAVAAVERAAWALGHALAAVVNVVDVPVVVLGGHLREVADLVGPAVELTLCRRVLSSGWAPPTVRVAGPDPAPGGLGAAYLQLQRVIDDPVRWLPGAD